MISVLRRLFKLNALLFFLVVAVGTSSRMLLNSHWRIQYSLSEDLIVWFVFTATFFRFVQMNLRLFPSGLELELWKRFGKAFPRMKKVFVVSLLVYQAFWRDLEGTMKVLALPVLNCCS